MQSFVRLGVVAPTRSGKSRVVDLDSKGLSRLRRVANPRDVWTSEAGDFTPWLAENIDVLADVLGMTLTVTSTEVPVGEFRLDIRAEDDEGRVVIIESQLERTDHSHLGQCLVYASGLEASTVVWVAPVFRDDFRRAFDWLNERTDLGVSFFGVELGVVEVGEGGPRAPVFEVVARPNDWQKAVKGSGSGSPGAISPLNARRQDFFADVLGDVIRAEPSIRMPARTRTGWIGFASGPFGYWALSVISDGRLRVEAYLDCGDRGRNKALLDEMAADAARWQQPIDAALSWERLDDKRASRIAVYGSLGLDNDNARKAAREWATATVLSLYRSMNAQLRERAVALREEMRGPEPAGPSAEVPPVAPI